MRADFVGSENFLVSTRAPRSRGRFEYQLYKCQGLADTMKKQQVSGVKSNESLPYQACHAWHQSNDHQTFESLRRHVVG